MKYTHRNRQKVLVQLYSLDSTVYSSYLLCQSIGYVRHETMYETINFFFLSSFLTHFFSLLLLSLRYRKIHSMNLDMFFMFTRRVSLQHVAHSRTQTNGYNKKKGNKKKKKKDVRAK